MRAWSLPLAMLFVVCSLSADDVIVKRALSTDVALTGQLIEAGDLETVGPEGFPGWAPWELGYEVDDQVRHGGAFSARCELESVEQHRGMTYEIELNQTRAVPLIAECWSKADGVTGGRDGNYSLYLDLVYTDGTSLWGQIAPFAPGTHDWQKRRVTVVPAKPVKSLQVHGIFRGRTGTAWFDDFKLWELKLQEGVRQFDSVPVSGSPAESLTVFGYTELGLKAGFCVRDVAAGSDFMAPLWDLKRTDEGLRAEGTVESLQLKLETTYRKIGDAMRIDGTVRDLSGKDRAVTVYCSYPVDATGWLWHDDQRASRLIEGETSYQNLTTVRAGASGTASMYPLACVSGDSEAIAIGAPMDVPRLYRFAYEAGSKELYAAVDLGLSAATAKFPSSASFSFVIYPSDPAWGFRSALQRYYDLFPECFTKRNEKEGIWMPFTDIATVQGFEDFGFQFQEGAPNMAFDEQHGIYSFTYVEPMSHWLSMPLEMERTNERAIALIKEQAAAGNAQSQATLTSAISASDGEWVGGITKAPWCDGALYQLNPSPTVRGGADGEMTQFDHEWASIRGRMQAASQQQSGWKQWEKGYEIVAGAGRNGTHGARVSRAKGDMGAGASQVIVVGQDEARPLVARAWTKAENVSGEPANNYCIYVDLTYTDGTPGWGFVEAAETGTHGWQLLERVIEPAKPVRLVTYHLLFRGPHEGTAWFDDAFLAEQGSDENLVQNPGFEPQAVEQTVTPFLDGTYIDSLEMGADLLNYRRDHFADTDTPLIFDDEGLVCQLGIFNTVEFTKEVASRMWGSGRMMFANSTPIRFPWAATYLDVMGIETNWAYGGEYAPNPDPVMNYRRAICYQRPYLLLLNTVYDDFEPEWVELYFKRCVAYGIFPSFFSHNAADDPYWARPDLYNRDRPLFKRWLPVIKSLSAAGWEPITYARSDNPKIYVERFGHPGGPLYLTLFNDSQEAQSAQISVDLDALELDAVPADLAGTITLQPEDVLVVQLAK